jgi:hypothetical protein
VQSDLQFLAYSWGLPNSTVSICPHPWVLGAPPLTRHGPSPAQEFCPEVGVLSQRLSLGRVQLLTGCQSSLGASHPSTAWTGSVIARCRCGPTLALTLTALAPS